MPARNAASRMVCPSSTCSTRPSGSIVSEWLISGTWTMSAARALQAREARRAEAEQVLVAEAVVGQRLVVIRLPRLAGLEPLGLVPVNLREVGVCAEDA